MSTALCEFGQKSDEATKAGSIAMTRAGGRRLGCVAPAEAAAQAEDQCPRPPAPVNFQRVRRVGFQRAPTNLGSVFNQRQYHGQS